MEAYQFVVIVLPDLKPKCVVYSKELGLNCKELFNTINDKITEENDLYLVTPSWIEKIDLNQNIQFSEEFIKKFPRYRIQFYPKNYPQYILRFQPVIEGRDFELHKWNVAIDPGSNIQLNDILKVFSKTFFLEASDLKFKLEDSTIDINIPILSQIELIKKHQIQLGFTVADREFNHAKNRIDVLKEIETSEERYVNDLERITKNFNEQLFLNHHIDPDVYRRTFKSVGEISPLHSAFYKSLKKIGSALETSIGPLFLDFIPFFKIAAPHVSNFSSVIEEITDLLHMNGSFEKAVFKICRTVFGGNTVESLLVTPVQRIPRYPLLLREVLKCMPDCHWDKDYIQLAYNNLTKLTQEIDQKTSEQKAANKMAQLQKKIGRSYNVLVSGRVLILTLNIEENSLYLFNDLLLLQLKQDESYKYKEYPLITTKVLKGNSNFIFSTKKNLYQCPLTDETEKFVETFSMTKRNFLLKKCTFDGSLRWTPKTFNSAGPPELKSAAIASILFDLYLFGGKRKDDGTVSNELWWFHEDSWELVEVTNAPKPRYDCSMNVFGTSLVVFGGHDNDNVVFDDLLVFDIPTANWTVIESKSDMKPTPRFAHASAFLGTQLWIYGGKSKDSYFNDLYCFDFQFNDWWKINTPKTPEPRAWATAFWIPEKIITKKRSKSNINSNNEEEEEDDKSNVTECDVNFAIFGGVYKSATYRTIWVFDYDKVDWVEVETQGDQPTARFSHVSAQFNNSLYVIGGRNMQENSLDPYRLDMKTKPFTWSVLPQSDEPNSFDNGTCCVIDDYGIALYSTTLYFIKLKPDFVSVRPPQPKEEDQIVKDKFEGTRLSRPIYNIESDAVSTYVDNPKSTFVFSIKFNEKSIDSIVKQAENQKPKWKEESVLIIGDVVPDKSFYIEEEEQQRPSLENPDVMLSQFSSGKIRSSTLNPFDKRNKLKTLNKAGKGTPERPPIQLEKRFSIPQSSSVELKNFANDSLNILDNDKKNNKNAKDPIASPRSEVKITKQRSKTLVTLQPDFLLSGSKSSTENKPVNKSSGAASGPLPQTPLISAKAQSTPGSPEKPQPPKQQANATAATSSSTSAATSATSNAKTSPSSPEKAQPNAKTEVKPQTNPSSPTKPPANQTNAPKAQTNPASPSKPSVNPPATTAAKPQVNQPAGQQQTNATTATATVPKAQANPASPTKPPANQTAAKPPANQPAAKPQATQSNAQNQQPNSAAAVKPASPVNQPAAVKPPATTTTAAKPQTNPTAAAKPPATTTTAAKPQTNAAAGAVKPSTSSSAIPKVAVNQQAKPQTNPATAQKPQAGSAAATVSKPAASTTTAATKPAAQPANPAASTKPPSNQATVAKPQTQTSQAATAAAKPQANANAAKPQTNPAAQTKPPVNQATAANPAAAKTQTAANAAKPQTTATATATVPKAQTNPSSPVKPPANQTTAATAKPQTSQPAAKPQAAQSAAQNQQQKQASPPKPPVNQTTASTAAKPPATTTAAAKPQANATAAGGVKPSTSSSAIPKVPVNQQAKSQANQAAAAGGVKPSTSSSAIPKVPVNHQAKSQANQATAAGGVKPSTSSSAIPKVPVNQQAKPQANQAAAQKPNSNAPANPKPPVNQASTAQANQAHPAAPSKGPAQAKPLHPPAASIKSTSNLAAANRQRANTVSQFRPSTSQSSFGKVQGTTTTNAAAAKTQANASAAKPQANPAAQTRPSTSQATVGKPQTNQATAAAKNQANPNAAKPQTNQAAAKPQVNSNAAKPHANQAAAGKPAAAQQSAGKQQPNPATAQKTQNAAKPQATQGGVKASTSQSSVGPVQANQAATSKPQNAQAAKQQAQQNAANNQAKQQGQPKIPASRSQNGLSALAKTPTGQTAAKTQSSLAAVKQPANNKQANPTAAKPQTSQSAAPKAQTNSEAPKPQTNPQSAAAKPQGNQAANNRPPNQAGAKPQANPAAKPQTAANAQKNAKPQAAVALKQQQSNATKPQPQGANNTQKPPANQGVSKPQPNQAAAKPQPNQAASNKQANQAATKPQPNQAASNKQANQAATKPQPNQAANNKQANQAATKPQPNQAASNKQANQAAAKPQANQPASAAKPAANQSVPKAQTNPSAAAAKPASNQTAPKPQPAAARPAANQAASKPQGNAPAAKNQSGQPSKQQSAPPAKNQANARNQQQQGQAPKGQPRPASSAKPVSHPPAANNRPASTQSAQKPANASAAAKPPANAS